MANRDTNLNINVNADNRASDELRNIAADVEAIEGEHTVTVAADDQASDELEQIEQAADDLDGRTATVDIRADDDSARKLDQITSDVRDLDGRKAEVTIDVDDNASRKLDQIQAKLRDLDGSSGSNIGAGVGGVIGGAVGAGAILDQLFAGGDLALQTQQVANATGSSLENASRLVAVWRTAGLDIADLLDLLGNLNSVIRDNPELATQLGLDTANDGVTTFLDAVRNLNTEFDNAGDRQAAAAQLFGEEGVKQVGLIQVQVGDLDAAVAAVAERQIVTPDDVEQARRLKEELGEAKEHVQELQLMLLQTVPIITGLLGGIVAYYNGAFNLGDTVANAGGDTRRFIEGLIPGGSDETNLGPASAPPRDTMGFGTSVPNDVMIAPRGRASGGSTTIVVNPPGTPASIVDGTRIYQQRNGLQ